MSALLVLVDETISLYINEINVGYFIYDSDIINRINKDYNVSIQLLNDKNKPVKIQVYFKRIGISLDLDFVNKEGLHKIPEYNILYQLHKGIWHKMFITCSKRKYGLTPYFSINGSDRYVKIYQILDDVFKNNKLLENNLINKILSFDFGEKI
jgi:hypothetical protein